MRLASISTLVVVGLAVLVAASPTLARLLSAAVWFVLAVGLVVCVVRLVWTATRRW